MRTCFPNDVPTVEDPDYANYPGEEAAVQLPSQAPGAPPVIPSNALLIIAGIALFSFVVFAAWLLSEQIDN